MKKLWLAVAVLGLLLTFHHDAFFSPHAQEAEDGARELLAPYQWFTQQRSYPDTVFPVAAYQQAMEIAANRLGMDKNSPAGYDRDWTVQGPYNIGGRYNTLAVDPTDSNIIYAGAAAGGVFKSTDGGKNWTPIFDQFSWLAIGTIVIDPKDHNTIYVGTGDPNISGDPAIGDGLYRSKDGGKTWTHLGLTDQRIISRIVIQPDSTNIIYAATMGQPFVRDSSRGLYKSIDSGKTWQQIYSLGTDAGIIDLVMQPGNPQVLYAAGWTRIRNNRESITVGYKNQIYKSTNGGRSWTILSNGLPSTLHSRIGLAISPTHPQKLYAVIVNATEGLDGIYKTTNGGDSWTALPTDGLDASLMSNYGWYFGKVFLSPTDDDVLYLPAIDLWKYDSGSWNIASPVWWTYEVHADKHDLQWLNNNSFLLATDGGIYKCNTATGAWTDIEETPVTQFYHVTTNPYKPGTYYGGAQDNGTSAGNIDNKDAWDRVYGGDGFQPAFVPDDSTAMFVETQYGSIFSYSNGFGFDFTNGIKSTDRKGWDMPYFVSPHDPKVMYTGSFRVYKTSQGSASADWQPISKDLTNDAALGNYIDDITTLTESPRKQGYLFAGTSDGRIWRSLNDGQNWTLINNKLATRYVTRVKASPLDDSTIYVTNSGYKDNDFVPHIHKSTNLGDTWTDISGDLPPVAVNDILICPKNEDILLLATDAGVYGTSDGGQHWNRLGNNMPIIPVLEVVYDSFNNRAVAATFARSIMTYPLDSIFPALNVGVQRPAANTFTLSSYPNPFTQAFHIRFGGHAGPELVELSLMDIRGRLLRHESYSAGTTEAAIDASALPKGIYLLQVKKGSQQQSLKILKQ